MQIISSGFKYHICTRVAIRKLYEIYEKIRQGRRYVGILIYSTIERMIKNFNCTGLF